MQTETEETLVHLYEFNGTADVALPSEDQIVSPSSGMSESDWKNALDEKIFENISYTLSRGSGDETYGIEVSRQTTADALYIRHANKNSGDTVTYYEILKYAAYAYSQSGDKWVRTSVSGYDADTVPELVLPLKDLFSYFSFDEEKDVYTASDLPFEYAGVPVVFESVTVAFSDGNITYMYAEMNNDGVSYFMEVRLSGHGVTVVDIPTGEEVIAPQEIRSEEEWRSAFDESIFDNISYTQTVTVIDPDTKEELIASSSVQIVREQDRWLIAQGDDLFYEVTPDVTYKFALIDGAWIKSEHTGSFAYDFCYFMCLKNRYETFKDCYDAQSETYIAKNIQVDIPADVSCESVTLSFAEKKLAFAAFVIADGAGSIECEIQYGKAIVSLPDDYTDET